MAFLPKKNHSNRPKIRRDAERIDPEEVKRLRQEVEELKKRYPHAVQLPPIYGHHAGSEKGQPVSAPPQRNYQAEQPQQPAPQKKPNPVLIGIIALSVFLLTLFFLFAIIPHPTPTPGTDDGSNTVTPSGNGYCSSNNDCHDFGTRNCGGYNLVLCGSDSLCHCCLTLMNERCITCAEAGSSCTASAGTYCERGACVFQNGGLTTQ